MGNLKLIIYSNLNEIKLFEMNITKEILNEYDININNENFTELFETEILNDIFEDYNMNSNEVYYSLK